MMRQTVRRHTTKAEPRANFGGGPAAAVLLSAILATGGGACQPNPAADPPAESVPSAPAEAATEGGPAREAVADAPAPVTRERARTVVEANRPGALIAELPAGPSWVVALDRRAMTEALAAWGEAAPRSVDAWIAAWIGIDASANVLTLDRADAMVVGGWPEDDGIAPLVGGPVAMLARQPAVTDGTLPLPGAQGARAVVREGMAFVGRGRAVGLMQAEVTGARGLGSHPVLQRLPSEAIVTALTRDLESPGLRGGVAAQLGAAGLQGVGVALTGDGAVHVVLHATNPAVVERTIARAQARWNAWMGVQVDRAPAEAAGLVRYAAVVMDSAWSRLRLRAEGEFVTLELVAPTCGGALANAPLAVALLAAVEFAEGLPAAGAEPDRMATFRGAVADGCAVTPARAPRVPTSLAHLASEGDETGFVLLFDHASVLDAVLPDLVGLLPFQIERGALDQAMRAGVASVRSLDDAEGSGAWVFEATATGSRQALVVPRDVGGASPGPILDLNPVGMRPYGRLFATPSWPASERTLGERVVGHPWVAAAESAPAGSRVLLLVSTSMLRPVLDRTTGSAFVEGVRGTERVGLGWDASGPYLWLPGVRMSDDEVRRGVSAMLTALSRGAPSNDRAQAILGASEGWSARQTSSGLEVRVAEGAGARVAFALVWALAPVLGESVPDVGIDPTAIPRPRVEWDGPMSPGTTGP